MAIHSPLPFTLTADYQAVGHYDSENIYVVHLVGVPALRLNWQPVWAAWCGPKLALWAPQCDLQVFDPRALNPSGPLLRPALDCPLPPLALPDGAIAFAQGHLLRVLEPITAIVEPAIVERQVDTGAAIDALEWRDGALLVRHGEATINYSVGLQRQIQPSISQPAQPDLPTPTKTRLGQRRFAIGAVLVAAVVAGAGLLWPSEPPFDPLDGSGRTPLGCQDFAADRAATTQATLARSVRFWRERMAATRDVTTVMAATGRYGSWGHRLALDLLLAVAHDPELEAQLGPQVCSALTSALSARTDLALADERALATLALGRPQWFVRPQQAVQQWRARLGEGTTTALAPLDRPLPVAVALSAPPEQRPLVIAWLHARGVQVAPSASALLSVSVTQRSVDTVQTVRRLETVHGEGPARTVLSGRTLRTIRDPVTTVQQVAVGEQVITHTGQWLTVALSGRDQQWQFELAARLPWLAQGAPAPSDWSNELRCGDWLWGTELGWLLKAGRSH